MRILTISASPFLLSRNGRVNRDVIGTLMEGGHHVESIVWSHDPIHFLATETGEHVYGKRQHIARLHPFLGMHGEFVTFIYEKMKVIQPDVVITIGSYRESTDIWAMKAMYRRLFKWVAVLTDGTSEFNEYYRERLNLIDYAVCTSLIGHEALTRLTNVPAVHAPYGPAEVFKPLDDELPEQFGVISLAKNAQIANPAGFIRGAVKADVQAYLHTNVDDTGDNDLRTLLRRYDKKGNVQLPDGIFVSLREGVSDAILNVLYNRAHAVVDCSMQSATGLTILEGMATGCVPVGVGYGAVGEIISKMPPEFRFTVEHESYIGPSEEEYAIVSVDSLREKLVQLNGKWSEDREWFSEARRHAVQVASIFSKECLLNRVKEVVDSAVTWPTPVAVDSYNGERNGS